jgi:Ala-tRNA(Pro) deacylase
MSISIRLKELLDMSGVVYELRVHPNTITAAETAASIPIPRSEMAKTVIVNADGLLRMAVVPANRRVDLQHLKFIMRSENIRIASEREFMDAFPGCEVGAMPPFGTIFGIPVYCDVQLERGEFIEFNAGTHYETVRMAFEDFRRLENPTITDLVDHSKLAA